MPGKYFRGAFIEFTSAMLIPIPNVIVFQYNPESLTHTWSPAASLAPSGGSAQGPGQGNPLAVSGDHRSAFSSATVREKRTLPRSLRRRA